MLAYMSINALVLPDRVIPIQGCGKLLRYKDLFITHTHQIEIRNIDKILFKIQENHLNDMLILGNKLIFTDRNGIVFECNLETFETRELFKNIYPVIILSIYQDNIITALQDGTIIMHVLESKTKYKQHQVYKHDKIITGSAFYKNWFVIESCGEIIIFDDLKKVFSMLVSTEARLVHITIVDNKMLIGVDECIQIWNLTDMTLIRNAKIDGKIFKTLSSEKEFFIIYKIEDVSIFAKIDETELKIIKKLDYPPGSIIMLD